MDVINENITCPAVGYQPATICVPVTAEPFAKAGITRTKCCGDALVIPGRQGGTGITAFAPLPHRRISALPYPSNSALTLR